MTKNIFSLTFGQGLPLVFNFVIFVIAARALGVENFGLFSSAIAIVGILSKFVDLGIEPIVFREFS
ncbi:MAG: oligosaccharide flippase family protein, partial [Melioribacteraceae bacterium]|nr:oligosaccharide flippase family protein [Melioribacteraceae bacterium]